MRLCGDMQCLVDWLYTWQTLISGLLALVAAVYATRKVREQITVMREQLKLERRHREDGIAAKQRVARVMILHALSEMCDYTTQSTDALMRSSPPAPPPEDPAKAIAALMSGVEYLPPEPAETLVQLLQFYQVQRARSGTNRQSLKFPVDLIFDCIWLRHLIDRLFEYSRGEATSVTPAPEKATFAEMKTAYTMCNPERVGALQDQVALLETCRRRASDSDQVPKVDLF